MSPRALIEAAARECVESKEYVLPVHLGLAEAACVIGALQLALRHPQNREASSDVVRSVIAAMIARLRQDGFSACAQIADLGYDPGNDQ